jgi:hypothetical protein
MRGRINCLSPVARAARKPMCAAAGGPFLMACRQPDRPLQRDNYPELCRKSGASVGYYTLKARRRPPGNFDMGILEAGQKFAWPKIANRNRADRRHLADLSHRHCRRLTAAEHPSADTAPAARRGRACDLRKISNHLADRCRRDPSAGMSSGRFLFRIFQYRCGPAFAGCCGMVRSGILGTPPVMTPIKSRSRSARNSALSRRLSGRTEPCGSRQRVPRLSPSG